MSIGLAVSEKGRTQYEISKALGRTPGALSRLLQSMVAEGLLIADPDPPVRGTLYRLHEEARDALEEAAGGTQQAGLLAAQQRIVLIPAGSGRLKLAELLAPPRFSGIVAWSARIDSDGMLLALNSAADDHQVGTLVVELERKGIVCHEGLVGEIVSGQETRLRSRSLSGSDAEVSQ